MRELSCQENDAVQMEIINLRNVAGVLSAAMTEANTFESAYDEVIMWSDWSQWEKSKRSWITLKQLVLGRLWKDHSI